VRHCVRSLLAAVFVTAYAGSEAIAASAKELDKQSIADRKNLAKTLDAEELATAARRDKTLRAALAAATEAMTQQEADENDRAAALESARKAWSSELDTLAKLLPQTDV